eukprot:Skav213824  [mRNA]  locus=scaffold1987:674138:693750:+ [translate_table: standard]
MLIIGYRRFATWNLQELLAELAQRDHTPSAPWAAAVGNGWPRENHRSSRPRCDAFRQWDAQAELAAELARAKAKIRDYEEELGTFHQRNGADERGKLVKSWTDALQALTVGEVSEARQLRISMEMQETVAADLRQQLWEAREQLQVAESMGWQSNKALSQEAAPAESAMGQALRQEQELAKHLHEELSEVEMAAITTAEAAEARIIQIEAMLKEDAIKAACEVEEEMAQEVQWSPRSRSPVSPVTGPSEAAPPQESASSPEAARARTRGMAFPNLSSGPCANFASRLANREDLKHDLMSPSDVKSWMDPSTISQPSLLSAAAKEAASLRKEAEQLRHEVRHWRASRPLRADPTPPEGPSRTGATSPVAAPQSEASQTARPDSLTKASRKSREAPLNAQVPTLAEQPPPRPPRGHSVPRCSKG